MSLYFQRERRNLEQSVESNGIVLFDIAIQSSETIPEPDPDDPNPAPPIPEPDFEYHPDGTIDLLRASSFIATWNMTAASGMATDGQVFQLKKRDYTAEALDPMAGEIWIPIGSSTAAFKVSPSIGLTTILVSEREILDYGKATIALFNMSDASIKLSKHPHTKAGILLFGIGPIDKDVTNLYQYVNDLYEFIIFSDVHVYNCYSTPFYYRSSGTGPNPNPGQLIPLSGSPDDNHYQIGIIWSGYTYNFWMISPHNTRSISFANNTTYYLLRAQDFEPLTWYQGQATFGTIWVEQSNNNYNAFPVMLDNTGIYFKPGSVSSVTNIKFTQTLVLSPPDSPLPSPDSQ